MRLKTAQAAVQKTVYEATSIFEELEAAGLVRGNGHHMRQKIAQLASDLLQERWSLEGW